MCNSSTQEVDIRRLEIQGYPWLCKQGLTWVTAVITTVFLLSSPILPFMNECHMELIKEISEAITM